MTITTTPPSVAVRARGPVSEAVLAVLAADPSDADPARLGLLEVDGGDDVLHDDDLQLALFLLYSLAYGGPTARDDLEWDPDVLALRARLEARHEAALRDRVETPATPEPTAAAVAASLFELTAPTGPPRLAAYLRRRATPEQLRELLMVRSLYHLHEADPHSWAIPRMSGRAKAALVEIQADEYGNGRLEAMHSSLFAQAMAGLGLSTRYGDYLDVAPAIVLASHNTMSLFALNRRLLGAIVGHLAAYEMTSTRPNAMTRDAFTRAGFDEQVSRFFDEHVLADAVHEQIAAHDLAGALAEQEPDRVEQIMLGAASSLLMDDLVGEHVLEAWGAGRSALYEAAAA